MLASVVDDDIQPAQQFNSVVYRSFNGLRFGNIGAYRDGVGPNFASSDLSARASG
jgi:hypothetical protein